MESQCDYQEDARLLSASNTPSIPQISFQSYEQYRSPSTAGSHGAPSIFSETSDIGGASPATTYSIPSPKDHQPEKFGIPVGVHRSSVPSKLLPWQKLQQLAHTWWLLELLACLGSVACLAFIAILLKRYEGRSQPTWPHNITLNSVVSGFATLFKAFLLLPVAASISQASWLHFRSRSHSLMDMATYDAASRGPWGSLMLLSSIRPQYLAGLGAFITILTLGVNPIIQQTMSVEIREVDSAVPATLNRAQTFLEYVGGPNIVNKGPPVPKPVISMVSAMQVGMFVQEADSKSALFDADSSCSSGNCTFPSFQTLGICSACENISELLSDPQCGDTPKKSGPYCQYSLPNGLRLNKTQTDEIEGTVSTIGEGIANRDIKYGPTILNFTRILSFVNDDDSLNKTEVWNNVTATHCQLYWCIHNVDARITNNKLEENITIPPQTASELWYNNVTEDAIWFSTGKKPETLKGNEGARFDFLPPTINDSSERSNFTISRYASQALAWWLVGRFNVSNSKAPTELGSPLDTTNGANSSSPEMVDLFRYANLDNMFSNMAKSMSRAVRNVPLAKQNETTYGITMNQAGLVGPVIGKATSLEVYVKIRWSWLVYPAALLVLTIPFFGLTAFFTMQRKVAIWKSSPIPMIFRGVRQQQPIVTDEIVPMEMVAQDTEVKLVDGDKGLRLVT